MNNYEAIRDAATEAVERVGRAGSGVILLTGGSGLEMINAMSRKDTDAFRPDQGYRPVPSGRAFTLGLMEGEVLQGQISVEIAQVGDGAEIYVDNIFVDADFRGRGVASRMRDEVVSVLADVAVGAEAMKEGASGHISPIIEGARNEASEHLCWSISNKLCEKIDETSPALI